MLLRPLTLLMAAVALPVTSTLAAPPAWVVQSNANAQVLLDVVGRLSPERAAREGMAGYDDKITDLSPGLSERTRAGYTAARDALVQRLPQTTDPLVRQDLEILIKSANEELTSDALDDRLMLPYGNIPELVFFGEFALLSDQVAPERRPAALARLRRYTGLEPGTKPATELAIERYTRKVAANPALVAPYKGKLEDDLAGIPRYLTGIRQLYAKYGLDKLPGAQEALDAMASQFNAYAAWIRTTVLPHARSEARLPPEIYAENLKQVGLDIAPQALISKAELEYAEVQHEMQTLAPLVAKEHGFPNPDYRAVIHELKKAQLTRAELEPYYRQIITQIEAIIRREHIVSLPDRPMRMRLASAAETAAEPAPHFEPPPLVGNTGQEGVFVLTTGNPEQGGKEAAFDDFSYKASAWTLAAHEGRPGHDLQFAAMVEHGVSLARALFAFNSVNVEGWALYAEAEMQPYEPLDGQLVALQLRLLRAARAFLDPMLNLGLIDRARALEVLEHDVCLSDGFAHEEVDRFMFRMPGQATSYFYGYTRLMALRTEAELALGPRFNRQAFNDFIIDQGLLPPNLLARAVREQFIPEAKAGKG